MQCVFNESQYPLSLGSLIDTINEDIASLGLSVTDATPLWLEARGGDGAQGKKHSARGGAGGAGGYARTRLRTGDLVNGILADGESLYILVGDKGRTGDGGSGGAATMVTGQDLEKVVGDARDPAAERVLIIGGGGGGGGAGETGSAGTAKGKAGGSGGVASGSLLSADSVEGGKGKGGDNSGQGGNQDEEGGGGPGHHNGKAGIGGLGGANGGEQAGWGVAKLDTREAGRGGNSSDGHGGSGGGGFGGGGGGKTCKVLSCGNGAGAGGSWARRATFENELGSFLGSENMPENDGKGVVVLTFRLD